MEEYHKELPFSSQTNVKEDAVSKVLGPEKSGRLRAYGEGVTITKLAIVSERDELIIQLEKECRELKEQVTTQQGLINILLKNQGSSCQTERQSNAPMPFTMDLKEDI
ncbi:hypothetical protein TIFTF001_022660 [Ficus carica]|uniref:Uncharacterized protein n=1 Tax=Ficus carica TaxID=3494 RepID=A0AA88AD08_FICCA|nr:hypothetical protein TIFTF001_022660 [Ficus carica]